MREVVFPKIGKKIEKGEKTKFSKVGMR